MADRASLGPVRVYGLSLQEVNRALIELSERIDALKGLRGRSEVWDRMRVEDPTAAQDAVTLGSAEDTTGYVKKTGDTMSGTLNGTTITGSAAPSASSHLTRKDYVDGTRTLAATGSMAFPGGLLVQWGPIANTAGGADTTETFHVAFPTACDQVVTSADGTAAAQFTVNGAPTTTQATFRNTGVGAATGRYVAVGH